MIYRQQVINTLREKIGPSYMFFYIFIIVIFLPLAFNTNVHASQIKILTIGDSGARTRFCPQGPPESTRNENGHCSSFQLQLLK